MSYQDFFHSLTPYNFVASKDDDDDDDDEENKDKEKEKEPGYFDKFTPEIMTIVDANQDKKIDFNEYIFFITLLQLPEGEVMRIIEKVNPEERKINKAQFAKYLTKLRKCTALGLKQMSKSFMPDGRKISTDEDHISKTILLHLFNDKEYITIEDFCELKSKLKHALLHYEFYQFDVDEDETISAESFAKSLLSCLNYTQASKYSRRIHSLKLEGRVSFKEYVAFHNLIEKADIIKMKISTYRFLSLGMFRDLCDDFAKLDPYCNQNKVSISDTQIATFFKVLDEDENGALEYDEVVDILEGKKNIGLGKEDKFKREMTEKIDRYIKKFQKYVGWT
ncbi:unnamed protein product [Moneuplotes crassus]|uniref:EF-hand domain-containing protein n=2 Tax=Euplotes crassus TaxID=5936 RepID=A0AAD1UKZ7_EUPCR|nr:unnamed protein product [Moneuplotes crassus]